MKNEWCILCVYTLEKDYLMNIIIPNHSNLPIYEQIKVQIKEKILLGELKAGQPLPSLRNLAQNLRVSLITTKRAYTELEQEGLIESYIGKGSFVANLDRHSIKTKITEQIEGQFRHAILQAKKYKITKSNLIKIIEEIYQEEII